MADKFASGEFLEAISDLVDPERWLISTHSGPNCHWTSLRPRVTSFPEQGFKLHLSALPQTAGEVLRRAAPILIDGAVSFKFAATRTDLQSLLNGRGGLTQVGKFLTIYPVETEDAVRLALRLQQATGDLSGPHIPHAPCAP